MFRWGYDKFDTGYKLFTLAFCRRFDCYLFRYPTGSRIPKHKDPSFGLRHYRLNIELVRAKRGGQFICPNMIFSFWRIHFFRADDSYHWVTPIEEGTRWLLSFGFRV